MLFKSRVRVSISFRISFGSLSLFSYGFWAAHSLFVWVLVGGSSDLLCKLELGLVGQKVRHEGESIPRSFDPYVNALTTIPRRTGEVNGDVGGG